MRLDLLQQYIDSCRDEPSDIQGNTPPLSKEYRRLQRVKLPATPNIDAMLSDLFSRRTSSRDYSGKSIPITSISSILQNSIGFVSDQDSRNYPSGGSCYPLTVYLDCKRVDDLESGPYFYSMPDHSLVKLPINEVYDTSTLQKKDQFIAKASVVFYLAYDRRRNHPTYNDYGYKLALIEAGHIMQNMNLVAVSLRLAHCPLGSCNPYSLNQTFDLDGINESIVYGLAVGGQRSD